MSKNAYINDTRRWLEQVVIDNNFCPFAKRELNRDSIYFHVDHQSTTEELLFNIIQECKRLDNTATIETTLLIYPDHLKDWDVFLELLDIAQQLIIEQNYEGIYQLASFHPDYCFEGTEIDDPANYTNRSPYPMIHLLRESSLEQALENYPKPELIPEQNINKARQLGLEKMQQLLRTCYSEKK